MKRLKRGWKRRKNTDQELMISSWFSSQVCVKTYLLSIKVYCRLIHGFCKKFLTSWTLFSSLLAGFLQNPYLNRYYSISRQSVQSNFALTPVKKVFAHIFVFITPAFMNIFFSNLHFFKLHCEKNWSLIRTI